MNASFNIIQPPVAESQRIYLAIKYDVKHNTTFLRVCVKHDVDHTLFSTCGTITSPVMNTTRQTWPTLAHGSPVYWSERFPLTWGFWTRAGHPQPHWSECWALLSQCGPYTGLGALIFRTQRPTYTLSVNVQGSCKKNHMQTGDKVSGAVSHVRSGTLTWWVSGILVSCLYVLLSGTNVTKRRDRYLEDRSTPGQHSWLSAASASASLLSADTQRTCQRTQLQLIMQIFRLNRIKQTNVIAGGNNSETIIFLVGLH